MQRSKLWQGCSIDSLLLPSSIPEQLRFTSLNFLALSQRKLPLSLKIQSFSFGEEEPRNWKPRKSGVLDDIVDVDETKEIVSLDEEISPTERNLEPVDTIGSWLHEASKVRLTRATHPGGCVARLLCVFCTYACIVLGMIEGPCFRVWS